MSLQEQLIQKQRDVFVENIDKELLSNLKFLNGEIQRQPKKILSDDEIITIFKKLKKTFMVEEEKNKKLINLITEYIPQQLSAAEIKKWILDNIDLDNLKNKNQIIGIVMKEFQNKVESTDVIFVVKNL